MASPLGLFHWKSATSPGPTKEIGNNGCCNRVAFNGVATMESSITYDDVEITKYHCAAGATTDSGETKKHLLLIPIPVAHVVMRHIGAVLSCGSAPKAE